MSGYAELLAIYTDVEKNHLQKALPIVESEFLLRQLPFTRFVRNRQPKLIAMDIVALEARINSRKSICGIDFKSAFIRSNTLVDNYKPKSLLAEEQVEIIKEEVISVNRHYVVAQFLIQAIDMETSKDGSRWIITTLLTFLGAFLGGFLAG